MNKYIKIINDKNLSDSCSFSARNLSGALLLVKETNDKNLSDSCSFSARNLSGASLLVKETIR
jgi:hypothetical protein